MRRKRGFQVDLSRFGVRVSVVVRVHVRTDDRDGRTALCRSGDTVRIVGCRRIDDRAMDGPKLATDACAMAGDGDLWDLSKHHLFGSQFLRNANGRSLARDDHRGGDAFGCRCDWRGRIARPSTAVGNRRFDRGDHRCRDHYERAHQWRRRSDWRGVVLCRDGVIGCGYIDGAQRVVGWKSDDSGCDANVAERCAACSRVWLDRVPNHGELDAAADYRISLHDFFPGLLATWIWFVLVGRIGAVKAAAYHFLNPVFGVAVAAVLLGEALSWLDIVGVLIIAGGILAVQLSKQQKLP